ncbi:DNA polymerase V family protein [Natranaeroarchaeum sulfidigenes]|uniref:Uncharacterized protein n=1 Tax=Natranaeroarchaeum sulfidigenes TaxID=2784880 RepID=A0A897MMB9_9EURY|nr:DNA polymerase V family protein [Natranaeroarchaeum sulfidigenes]QSG01764.1 Uncharacterized protein AArcS_0536 [Natranaeroarchaeum sulfidigenes]
MPEIEITEDQQEYLEDLRSELEADIVGPYGHVRVSDAVQYLIDDHDGTLDDVLAEGVAGADADGSDDQNDAESDIDDEETDSGSADEDAEPEEADSAGDESDSAGDEESQSGEDRLSAMMSLLDTHDDKWRETDGDARYEVDLPDGTTEDAPTKDDVRAVLFKNY